MADDTIRLFGVPIQQIDTVGGDAAYYKVVIGPYILDFIESNTTHKVLWCLQLENEKTLEGTEKSLEEAVIAVRERLRKPLQNLATALKNLDNLRG